MSGSAARSGKALPVPAGYQVVPATLVQTTSVERLAEFYYRSTRGIDSARLVYPAAYFEWLGRLPGANPYLDAVLIGPERQVAGLALARPLTLGMWANLKLRTAIQEASAETPVDRSPKGWVRYLTRLRDHDLAIALSTVLPEEYYALRSAVVEFLEVAPELAGPDSEARALESMLVDVLVDEARASGYDYVLAWVDANRPIPRLAKSAGTTALYDELPAIDRGILGLVNSVKEAYRSLVDWVAATYTALARLRERIRVRLGAARVGHWREALHPAGPEGTEGRESGEKGYLEWAALARAQRERRTTDVVTLSGIRLRRVGTEATPLDDNLVERLRDLIGSASERFALFPTYSPEQVVAALAPSQPEGRFLHRYAAVREAAVDARPTNLDHDVLAFVAERDGRLLSLVFGHRLPRLSREGLPHETFVIRAAYFSPDVGPITRADVLRSAAEAAARALGIARTLYLRPTGLREVAFSRFVLGARRASEPLVLHYVPLSERARAEETILERELPVSYL